MTKRSLRVRDRGLVELLLLASAEPSALCAGGATRADSRTERRPTARPYISLSLVGPLTNKGQGDVGTRPNKTYPHLIALETPTLIELFLLLSPYIRVKLME